MKVCKGCGEIKDLNCFSKHPQNSDGRVGKCKVCVAAYHRERNAPLPADKKKRSEANRRGTAAWKERNRIQVRANKQVYHAIKTGKIVRRPCEVCGNVTAEAHHDDYNYPLSVRFLCRTHHQEWHLHNVPKRPVG